MIEVQSRGHGLCLDCKKDFKVCLCTYEGEREKAAEEYSDRQFRNAESFSVMKDVCNDEVFVEAFADGCDWGRKWADQISDYHRYVMASKLDQLDTVYKAQAEDIQKFNSIVSTLEGALNRILHMSGDKDKRTTICNEALEELEFFKKACVFYQEQADET